MAITRWKPHDATMRTLWPETWSPVTRLMEEFFNSAREGDMLAWGPNVDIVENPDGYEIVAELPGVRQEDVKITLDNNVLTLSGEKKQELKEDRDNVLRVERSYGHFERSFSLPSTVKGDAVRATYEDGVLHIHLPKAETAKAHQIQIENRIK
jgi:HSP20 family protein